MSSKGRRRESCSRNCRVSASTRRSYQIESKPIYLVLPRECKLLPIINPILRYINSNPLEPFFKLLYSFYLSNSSSKALFFSLSSPLTIQYRFYPTPTLSFHSRKQSGFPRCCRKRFRFHDSCWPAPFSLPNRRLCLFLKQKLSSGS